MNPSFPKTYCNPLPLVQYQQGRDSLRPKYKRRDYREMADPTVIFFEGKWYLFPSAGMLWHSDDMVNWTHHPVEPFDPGYAPTVVQKGEWLYLSASWDASAIWRARHPFGPWEKLGEKGNDLDGNEVWLKDHEGNPIGWGDPCLFVDDDGTMYCYCNLARATRPEDHHPYKLHPDDGLVYGVRLSDDDPTRFAEAPRKLIAFDPKRTWERVGEYNQSTYRPVLEGAWMNKINGRYYLQYSANGTEYKNYCVGCFTSDQPLGPFIPQKKNPILIHKGGLVNGCAHHSIVEGPNKSLWCFYTTLVRIEHNCERRIGMDPAGIDENGELYVAGPTETPQLAPGISPDPLQSNGLGLLPLSVGAHATASSFIEGRDPVYAIDNSVRTWWQAEDASTAQWLEVELCAAFHVSAARTMFADRGLDYKKGIVPAPYHYRILGSVDRKNWDVLLDRSENNEERHIAYDTWQETLARYVRLEVLSAPAGMAISVWEFTVFGKPHSA